MRGDILSAVGSNGSSVSAVSGSYDRSVTRSRPSTWQRQPPRCRLNPRATLPNDVQRWSGRNIHRRKEQETALNCLGAVRARQAALGGDENASDDGRAQCHRPLDNTIGRYLNCAFSVAHGHFSGSVLAFIETVWQVRHLIVCTGVSSDKSKSRPHRGGTSKYLQGK